MIEDMVDDAKNKAGSKNPLTNYNYHSGGDMCGSHHSETVMPFNETHARISISHANWHFEDPKADEYLVDIEIMKKLEDVFRKYSMEKWNNKKFTDMFVCDGASYGYSFRFGDRSCIGFSSQIYPKKYSEKLQEFHDIVNAYIEKGEKLPALKLPEKTDEEAVTAHRPQDGNEKLEVFGYCEGILEYRFCNGTDEKLEYDRSVKLFREGEAEVIAFEDDKYHGTCYPHSTDDGSLKIPGHLTPGVYRLEMGKYTASFNIE